jgi:hypothetical protein
MVPSTAGIHNADQEISRTIERVLEKRKALVDLQRDMLPGYAESQKRLLQQLLKEMQTAPGRVGHQRELLKALRTYLNDLEKEERLYGDMLRLD